MCTLTDNNKRLNIISQLQHNYNSSAETEPNTLCKKNVGIAPQRQICESYRT
jgi:hypothetical protein